MVSTHTPTITNTPPRYNHLSIIALHTPKKKIPILLNYSVICIKIPRMVCF